MCTFLRIFKNIKYATELPIKYENIFSSISLCPYICSSMCFPLSLSRSPSLCPLVSVLCSGIYETNASVSHLVTHTAHTHTLYAHSQTHARLNARVSGGLSNRASVCEDLWTWQDAHTPQDVADTNHTETHSDAQWEREINNMQTRSPPWDVDT